MLKRIGSRILMPLTRWYLRKERRFRYRDIVVDVWPGVFHPGLFSSTLFLLEHLDQKDLREKRFLEPGCGTGLISIVAAKRGAQVTAVDINPRAIQNAAENLNLNGVTAELLQSDLFDQLQPRHFDWIVINPPYYPKNPTDDAAYAWYCGEHFEYFEKLFSSLGRFIHADTSVLMVLTKGCDLERIFSIAATYGYACELRAEKSVLFDEKDYLFGISPLRSWP